VTQIGVSKRMAAVIAKNSGDIGESGVMTSAAAKSEHGGMAKIMKIA